MGACFIWVGAKRAKEYTVIERFAHITDAPPERKSVRDQLRQLQAGGADRETSQSEKPKTEKDSLTPQTPQGSIPALRDYKHQVSEKHPIGIE